MAGHPLRSATDRRLGGPLPRQLPNQTRIHPTPPELFTQEHALPCAYAVLAAVSGCCPPVWGRLSTRYSPVRHSVTQAAWLGASSSRCHMGASFDLHVLSTPPAFILSQDQTLNDNLSHPRLPFRTRPDADSFILPGNSTNVSFLYCFSFWVADCSASRFGLMDLGSMFFSSKTFKVVPLFHYQGTPAGSFGQLDYNSTYYFA